MNTVCICGSRELGKHQDYEQRIRKELDIEMRKENWINVGDASGADILCQQILANQYYPNVKVWHIGSKPRNYANRYNQWKKVRVEGNYTARDIQMLENTRASSLNWKMIYRQRGEY